MAINELQRDLSTGFFLDEVKVRRIEVAPYAWLYEYAYLDHANCQFQCKACVDKYEISVGVLLIFQIHRSTCIVSLTATTSTFLFLGSPLLHVS